MMGREGLEKIAKETKKEEEEEGNVMVVGEERKAEKWARVPCWSLLY